MGSILQRNMHRNMPDEDSDISTEKEPLFQHRPNGENQINIIRNINTYARTKTLAQGFLDMALFTANASQMKHLLQQGTDAQFYYFLFVLLCISIILQLMVAALLIYKGSKNIENDDPEHRLSDRVHLLNNIVTGLILVITAVKCLHHCLLVFSSSTDP
ncbi:ninjurin-1-like [Alligator sinensis]|uniref:Ninjurin-1-like n=1 Tax=Alligator sinensis TaxID=38654 RepID=A0A3Q0HK31_ALLSI|nr:ninjurin-1-like [Alligator sinensis]XP_025072321.1 ninjurin-1-like [Alligator sinensis]XP_025072327.1 ninjurin-1-like [Alligator sinensis]XP_025072334.1 ninjurin-1-like [Alligator sinensis]